MAREWVFDCSSTIVDEDMLKALDEPAWKFERGSFAHAPERADKVVALQYFRYGFGGAERITHALMGVFAQLGYRVILYTDVAPEPGDYPLPNGVVRKHVAVPYENRLERIRYWRSEVDAENISLVVYSSWCSPVALLDCLAVKSAGARFVFHVHGSAPFITQIDDPPLALRLERVTRTADAVVALSEPDAVFWRAYSNNVHVVANPVDAYLRDAPQRACLPEGKTVLWCGRFSFYEKRPDEAVRVMEHLVKKLPDARLVFVGAGNPDEERALKQCVEQSSARGAISFAGYQADVIPFYHLANALLVTSISEGFPLAVSEAMQQGVPVVSYELPFLQVAKGEGFVQVPQLDCEAAADELARLLSDPTEQMKAGQAARAVYDEVCCVDFGQVWQTIIDSVRYSDARDWEQPEDPTSLLVRNFMYQYRCSDEKRAQQLAAARHEVDELRGVCENYETSRGAKAGMAVGSLVRTAKDYLRPRREQ